ncbi:hypothetical protein PF66_06200 [Pseudomonas asplenii]|uniref:Phage neck terminator protein gp12-like domain-containing protein n=1 Tax=Pseudomonas asplenii TaxID=53407 RepID=A0A0N1J5L2_9PSED|nr:hypothetical protein [Pseudomonas fuscovaginae]KPA87290.1 hypothetical protein PF66_06200 [Pseudomonas fuscovaginae]
MISADVSEDDLLTALRGFLLPIVGGEVVQAQENGVPMPKGQFVTMTTLRIEGISTNKTIWADTGSSATSQIKNTRSSQWTVQIDVYGQGAMDRANALAELVRTDYACTQFAEAAIDIQPLYATEPHQTTMINGEQQYEPRWTFDFVAQFNPVIATPMQYADSIQIEMAEVATTFPPRG